MQGKRDRTGLLAHVLIVNVLALGDHRVFVRALQAGVPFLILCRVNGTTSSFHNKLLNCIPVVVEMNGVHRSILRSYTPDWCPLIAILSRHQQFFPAKAPFQAWSLCTRSFLRRTCQGHCMPGIQKVRLHGLQETSDLQLCKTPRRLHQWYRLTCAPAWASCLPARPSWRHGMQRSRLRSRHSRKSMQSSRQRLPASTKRLHS